MTSLEAIEILKKQAEGAPHPVWLAIQLAIGALEKEEAEDE